MCMRDYESKLVDSSRLLADILVDDIGNDQERFNEMMDIASRDEYPLSMRAARIIALSSQNYPELMVSRIDQIIKILKKCKTDGVRRSLLKILTGLPIPFTEDQLGILTDLAFAWLTDIREPVSVRYYSIEILQIVAGIYPEIGTELSQILSGMMDGSSSGLKAKSRKVLHHLRKQQ